MNVFAKPSAEPNAVRTIPRRENEEGNSTFSLSQMSGAERSSSYAMARKRLLKTNEPFR